MHYKTIPVSEDLFKDLQRIKQKTEEQVGCKISWDVFIENLLHGNRDIAIANAMCDLVGEALRRR